MGRVKRIWYLSPMRAAKVQASLRIRAVSPEPPLLAHTSSESRGTFNQKARSLVPVNDWACAGKICHDGMLEDTNSLDGAQMGFYHVQYQNRGYDYSLLKSVDSVLLLLLVVSNEINYLFLAIMISLVHSTSFMSLLCYIPSKCPAMTG